MIELPVLLDRLEAAGGPPGALPSADGWELVLPDTTHMQVTRRADLLLPMLARFPG
jgi:hypothetical protein